MRQESLETCIVFLLLSRHDNHQHDMLQRLSRQLDTDFKDLNLPSAFAQSLGLFTRREIIDTPYPGQREIETHGSVHKIEGLEKYWIRLLGERVVQHNLRIIAQYYKHIELSRLCALLQLTSAEAEQHLSEMSFKGDLQLKIDRPAGIVSFTGKKGNDEILSDWAGDVGKLLGLLETTCHMVNREMMVHKV
ncbi:hypothetical protein EON65_51615 [archaeon]|nr:MAG: hypothetical protein EON65_51615 [archaeon]